MTSKAQRKLAAEEVLKHIQRQRIERLMMNKQGLKPGQGNRTTVG